jgi:hypothetical protein
MITTEGFLSHLFASIPDGLFVEFTFIAPPKSGIKPHIATISYEWGHDEIEWLRFGIANEMGYGVYYAVTPKHSPPPPRQRSTEKDAAYCSALWVDIDTQDKDAAYNAICEIIPECSVIIDTGGGLQGLWFIKPVKVTPESAPVLKQALRGLALATGGDTSVAELARVLRLPGSVNTKPERNGALCSVVSFLGNVGTLEEFADYRALAIPSQLPAVRRELPPGAALDLPYWVQSYLEQGAPPGQRNNRLFAATIEYRVNGRAIMDAERELGARASADGLSDSEIRRTIESAWRSPHGGVNLPGHLRAIAAADDSRGVK